MLVLSRIAGESICVGSPGECLVTVMMVLAEQSSVSIQVCRASEIEPGKLENQEITLECDGTCKVMRGVELTLVDVREEKARIGFVAPKDTQIHRKEVYDAIQRENQAAADGRHDEDDGLAGARVPRPSSPKPPTLDVPLDEPETESDEGGK